MKKVLYTTTALAAVGLLALAPSDAMAQKKKVAAPKLTLGGFYRHNFGWSSQDSAYENAKDKGFNSFNNVGNSEVYFKSKTKLDNGITISTMVQLETDRSNTTKGIDESWIQFDGAFGTLRAGTTAAAGFYSKLGSATPTHTTGILLNNHPDQYDFIVKPRSMPSSNSLALTGGAQPSGFRYNYFTPRISGLRASVGYLPSNPGAAPPFTDSDSLQASGKLLGTSESQIDYGLNYRGKFGDVSVRADVGGYHRIGSDDAPDEHQWRTGLNLLFGGFTIGAEFQEIQMDMPSGGRAADVASADQSGWGVGMRYITGPWTVATNYYFTKAEGETIDPDDDEYTQYGVQAKYKLSKGIDLAVTVNRFDFDDETSNNNKPGNSNDGWIAVMGIGLSF